MSRKTKYARTSLFFSHHNVNIPPSRLSLSSVAISVCRFPSLDGFLRNIVLFVIIFPDTKFNNGRVKNQETIDLKIKSKYLVRIGRSRFFGVMYNIVHMSHYYRCGVLKCHVAFLSLFSGGTLDRYDKKLDAVENGSYPPTKEVADFEQAIELTGNCKFWCHVILLIRHFTGDYL